MNDRNKKEIVEYWAHFLKNPQVSVFDNGDHSNQGAMMAMMFEMAKPSSASLDQVKIFEDVLMKELDDTDRLRVDYDPDYSLSVALEKSGLSKNSFPCKTSTFVTDGEVFVAEGYGKKAVPIKESRYVMA